jgi:hypothetical protein
VTSFYELLGVTSKSAVKIWAKAGAGGSHLNSSCSGGSDQEDQGLKPAWANGFQDPISKTPNTEKEW